ncbi:MAG: hypothetical protein GY757_41615 [bacterium]|nr:hypothetical protein [bacterium]
MRKEILEDPKLTIEKESKKTMRPKVTGVTLDVVYPDGNSRTITIDPTVSEGIFWNDRVVEVLGAYYEEHNTEVTIEDLETSFGIKKAKRILGENPSRENKCKVSKEMIKQLWEWENDDGFRPTILGKSGECKPR